MSPLGGCEAGLRHYSDEFRKRAKTGAGVSQEDLGHILKVRNTYVPYIV